MQPRTGRRGGLRLSANRIKNSSKARTGQKRRLVRNNNDQLGTFDFDTHVKNIFNRLPISLTYSTVCADSLFFKGFVERHNQKGVISWMLQLDCLEKRYVFVPICLSNHWSLLILCNFNNEFNSSTAPPCMLLLDSLLSREMDLEPDIRKFVYDIIKKGKPETSDELIRRIKFRIPKVPQQKDSTECGFYVLFFIYRFLMECPDQFNLNEDYPSFMKEDWFTLSEFNTFYDNLLHVWEEVEFEEIQIELNSDDSKKDSTKKKDEAEVIDLDSEIKDVKVNKKEQQLALVLYTPESSIPDSSPDANTQYVEEKKLPNETKVQKKILKIKLKQVESRRSPRFVTPLEKKGSVKTNPVEILSSSHSATKRRRIATTRPPARVTRSAAKQTENLQHINTSCLDEETESDKEPEIIERKMKKSAKRKLNKSQGPKNQRKKRKMSMPKDGKEKKNYVKKQDAIQIPKKLKLRAHPSNFSEAMQSLTDGQKQWIKDAGFGHLLSFSFRHIPIEMARDVVWFYDPYNNWLNLADDKVIKINEDDVHNTLGLPKGGRNVILGPVDSEVKETWREQYPEKKAGHKVTELMVMKKIARTDELNLQFKQNFMVLMYNLFIRCTRGSFVSQQVLGLVGSFDDTNQMNWCKLVIDGLKGASVAWLDDPIHQYYTGPLMFLLFFYLDRVENDTVKVDRKEPAFLGWSNFNVLQRNQAEIVDKTFGKGKIEGEYEERGDSQEDDAQYFASQEDNFEEHGDSEPEHCEFEAVNIEKRDDMPQEKEVIKEVTVPTVVIEEGDVETIVTGDNNNQFPDKVIKDVTVPNVVIEEGDEETIFTGDNNNQFPEKNFVDMQQFETPTETIKGVNSFEKDGVRDGILSIAKDISYAFADEDEELIKEQDLMLQIRKDIDEMKRMKKACQDSLKTAKALFPSNHDIKNLEEDFRKLINQSDGVESIHPMVKFGERPRREVKLGELHKSPFRERTIDIDKSNLSKAEEDVWKWLNASNDYPMQKIFIWQNKVVCTKHEIQTLQLDRQLVCGVLDTYTCILNEEEKFRSLESPRRFFCNTYNTYPAFTARSGLNTRSRDKEKNADPVMKANQYRMFKENLDHVLEKHLVDIKNVDLVFFPIHYIHHFFVICFNLKSPAIEILDNNKVGENITSIYDGIPEILQENFVKYMMDINVNKATDLANVAITRLEMKWRTEKNQFDCGIYAIRHMETYKGNGVRGWESKLLTETDKQAQKKQLKKARQLYAFKIISCQLNSMRLEMQEEINETVAHG